MTTVRRLAVPNAIPMPAPKLYPMPPIPSATRKRPSRRAGRWWMAEAPMLPASTTMSAPSGSAASSTRHRVAVPDAGAVMRWRLQLGVRHRVRHSHAGRTAVADSAAVSSVSDPRRSSVWTWVHGRYGVADPIEYVGTDGQRVVQTGAGGHRQPGADQQAHRAVARSAAATPGWPITPVTPSADDDPARCARDVLGVGDGGHPRPQQRAQLLEFGAGVVAGHLLSGDDRDRPVGVPQRPTQSAAGSPECAVAESIDRPSAAVDGSSSAC